jgi:hypothetical protein
MDGSAEQQMLWRIEALREALGNAIAMAQSGINVDDHNAAIMAQTVCTTALSERLRREASASEDLEARAGDSDIPVMREAAERIDGLVAVLKAFVHETWNIDQIRCLPIMDAARTEIQKAESASN